MSARSGCSSAGGDDVVVVAADDAALGDGVGLSGDLADGAPLVTTANVNFRSSPEIAVANVIRVLERGARVVAAGGAPQNGFFAVSSGETRGFISARYLAHAASAGDGTSASGFRVTYIGDSHSDFEGSGGTFASVALFAASSSAPNWWLDGTPEQAATWGYTQTVSTPARRKCHRGSKTGTCVPKLGAVLSERPRLFVIEQGTNLLGRSKPDVTNQVRTMIQQIDGKVDACLWVGAPSPRAGVYSEADQQEVWQAIATNAAPRCFVYDSRYLPRKNADGTPLLDEQGKLVVDVPLPYDAPHGDGVHLGAESAARWADGVGTMIDWIRSRQH